MEKIEFPLECMIFKYMNKIIVVLPRKRITKTLLGSQIKTGERVIIIFDYDYYHEETTKPFNIAFEVVHRGEKIQRIMVGKFLDSTINELRDYNIEWLFNAGHRFFIEKLGLNLNFDGWTKPTSGLDSCVKNYISKNTPLVLI